MKITLKDSSTPIIIPQYPLGRERLMGLKLIIDQLKISHLLNPVNSPYNMPILSVKKPNGSFRLVQDLKKINIAVNLIHLVVPNPYTLLSKIPLQTSFFSVLDLKDAFFTIPLHPNSKPLLAFTWTDPITHHTQQLTWTVLSQGFRDSPYLFGQVLQQDLNSLNLFPRKLI
jgi:hypothetical protein